MNTNKFSLIDQNIYLIETDLLRPGLAACYLMVEGDQAAIIETGTYHSVGNILEALAAAQLSPEQVKFIMPTHVHLDHAGGAGELLRLCPNATLVVHEQGAKHLIDPSKLLAGAEAVYGEESFKRDYGTLVAAPAERVHAAQQGDTFNLNGRLIEFFDTPGHANHHGCFFDHQTRGFFTGDTLGISYREFDTERGAFIFATTTPVALDPEAWHRSLDLIMAQNPAMFFLTHYGKVTDVARLCEDLRQSLDAMIELTLLEERLGQDNSSNEDRFQRLYTGVMSLLTTGAAQHGVTLNPSEVKALLDFDVDLNAKGLEVWLQRRARKSKPLS